MAIPLRRSPLETRRIDAHEITPRERRVLLFQEITLSALRIVTGFLFMQHGVQKLFGLLLPPDRPFNGAPEPFSMMWVAGGLEVFGGALIVLGLLTRPVAFLLAGEMAVAYFRSHAPEGFWPILNHGELAALYCFVFLALCAFGAGRFSIDGLISGWRNRRPTLLD